MKSFDFEKALRELDEAEALEINAGGGICTDPGQYPPPPPPWHC